MDTIKEKKAYERRFMDMLLMEDEVRRSNESKDERLSEQCPKEVRKDK
jgi:hypothetical protein